MASVFSGQPTSVKVIYLKHAILALFQRFYLLELVHLDQKFLKDLLGVKIAISFDFPARLLLVQQLMTPLAFQLEQTVH